MCDGGVPKLHFACKEATTVQENDKFGCIHVRKKDVLIEPHMKKIDWCYRSQAISRPRPT